MHYALHRFNPRDYEKIGIQPTSVQQIMLGLSNISFGLNPPARQVLNSVFLDHALRRGMTGAIVHFSKIQPLHRIPAEEVQVAEDLIYDRRREGYDPLQAFLALFQDRTIEKAEKKGRPEKIEERLAQRIVDGDRLDLEGDLALAMQSYKPLDIIKYRHRRPFSPRGPEPAW